MKVKTRDDELAFASSSRQIGSVATRLGAQILPAFDSGGNWEKVYE
jgi:hypothetical protein